MRNWGTIGGSLCQADPSEDLSAAFGAVRATAVIRGRDGVRFVPVREFHLGPYETVVAPGELLTELRVPIRPGGGSAYEKVARRVGDWSVAAAGTVLWLAPAAGTAAARTSTAAGARAGTGTRAGARTATGGGAMTATGGEARTATGAGDVGRQLGRQMARLSRVAYRIVWANPRTKSPRYKPKVSGMAAAWPYCDAVVSAHSLNAIDDLITALASSA